MRLHDWRNTARAGMTVELGVRDCGPADINPFKGLRCGRDSGQRMKLWVGPHHDEVGETAPAPHYSGEAVLMRWADDAVNGMTVRMELDAGPDGSGGKHPFEGFATGRKEGEAMHLVAWLVNDDESLQHPRAARRRTPFHELSEIRQSQILCRDQRFVSFLAAREAEGAFPAVEARPQDSPSEFAGQALRAWLGVASRAELGHDSAAGARARRGWETVLRDFSYSGFWRGR